MIHLFDRKNRFLSSGGRTSVLAVNTWAARLINYPRSKVGVGLPFFVEGGTW